MFRRLKSGVILLNRVSEKIFHVVDDSDVKRAARTPSNLFAELKILLRDLEQVAAGAWVREGLQLLVPLHVFYLHVIVRHRWFRGFGEFGGDGESATDEFGGRRRRLSKGYRDLGSLDSEFRETASKLGFFFLLNQFQSVTHIKFFLLLGFKHARIICNVDFVPYYAIS